MGINTPTIAIQPNHTPAQTGEAAKAAWLEQRRNYITGTE